MPNDLVEAITVPLAGTTFIATFVVAGDSGTQLLNGARVGSLHLGQELRGNFSTKYGYLLPTAEDENLSLTRALVGKTKITRSRFHFHDRDG